MKRIVVPTDFSRPSELAAETATKLAKALVGEVYFLHVVDIPYYSDLENSEGLPPDHPKRLITKRVHENFVNYLNKEYLNGVSFTHELRYTNVKRSILDFVESKKADIVVMGFNGESGLHQALIGSAAEQVIRHANCPVLVVKDKIPKTKYRRAVYASNFLVESYAGYKQIEPYLNFLCQSITLLRVNTPGDFQSTNYSTKLMEDFAEEMEMENVDMEVYNDFSVESGVQKFSQKLNADLVIMQTHGSKGLMHMVLGSVVEKVAHQSATSILSLKIPELASEEGVLFPGKGIFQD